MAILLLPIGGAPALAVPAAPNESAVTAEVVRQDSVDSTALNIEPKQTLYRWTLRIIKVGTVQKMANFLVGHEGKSIEVLSKEAPAVLGLAGKTIQARISFRSDEKSGRYWLIGTPEVKSQ